MRINYEYQENSGFLKTMCPNGQGEKVGNIKCIVCKHNIFYSYNKKYVGCAYPDVVE